MKILFATAAIGMALLLQGCETTASLTTPLTSAVKSIGVYETGVYVSNATMSALVDHKSTQADVVVAVGRTSDRQILGKLEVWNYGYTKIATFSGNVSETTVFEFDRNGVLLSHYKAHGNTESGNALTKAAGM